MSSAGIDRAIRDRWLAQNLEAKFRAFWEDPSLTGVTAFNDSEARPNTPMPYCIYEKGTGIMRGRSTGSECDPSVLVEYWTMPIQFTVITKTPGRSEKNFGRTGKDIAAELVGQGMPDGYGLLKAYDDALGKLDLGGNDQHIQTHTMADYHIRDDDDVWSWIVNFDIEFERRRQIRGQG